jgi:hypothetical protein
MQIKIEIRARDSFWRHAFDVEWEAQFPDRKLIGAGENYYLADSDWLDDLQRVAAQVFCKIVRAPENPQRRRWFSSLLPSRGRC